MSKLKSDREIALLYRAIQAAGGDPNDRRFQLKNPCLMDGPMADKICRQAQLLDAPQFAAWQAEAGQSTVSVATAAAMAGVIPKTEIHHQEMMETNERYRDQHQQDQLKFEEEQKRRWDESARNSKLQREIRLHGGNEIAAKRKLDAEAAMEQQREEQRLASAQHAAEMQKRIDQRRQQADRMAGRFIQP